MHRLKGKNIVVYDCEIENEIDGQSVTWSTYDKMGFSVGCLYDYRTDDYHVYFRDDIKDLAGRLNEADLVIGFNTMGFDNNLLRALGSDLKADGELKNYDLLHHSRSACGWRQGDRFPTGLKLDNHLEATFGKAHMKTEDGAMAPVMWRQGQRGRTVTYCLGDVKRERMLFEHIFFKGWAATATHGRKFFDLSPVHAVLGA